MEQQTQEQLNEVATQLSQLIPQLPDSKIDFAASLIKQQLRGKNTLSEKQVYWLNKLVEIAQAPKPEAVDVGADLKGFIGLFVSVGQKLKYPKITLEVGEQTLQFSQTKSGPNAGCVNITDGGPYGANKWYGRITTDGKWMPGRAAEEVDMLEDFLVSFAADPAKMAAEYGHKSGRCCFCISELTNEGSVEVGYGPVCAKNWNLPWSPKAKAHSCEKGA